MCTESSEPPRKLATFYFLAELNEFLSPFRRNKTVSLSFRGNQSVKHLVESLGVPHTEVGRILVNSNPADFSYIVQDGDQVQIYPVEACEEQPDKPPNGAKFILDNHLGRLAVYLRMLGFDALYHNNYQDGELALVCSQEGRILLTRDRRLLMRNSVVYGYCVRSKIPREQLVEVLRRYNLFSLITPFKRCMRCNGLLVAVPKEDVLHRLEPLTKKYFDEFCICQDCDQIYWRGSHYQRMQQLIEQVVNP